MIDWVMRLAPRVVPARLRTLGEAASRLSRRAFTARHRDAELSHGKLRTVQSFSLPPAIRRYSIR